jgi:N-acetylmuramic acid 6-phosphate etherase
MQATECDINTAKEALNQANNQTKLASLMVLTGLSAENAQNTLNKNKGFLRKSFNTKGTQ